MKVGDKIRVQKYIMGYPSHCHDYEVEEFRYCLGIFLSKADRVAENFTPLCKLYERGPESEDKYYPNYGSYVTNKVPAWMDIVELKYTDYDH